MSKQLKSRLLQTALGNSDVQFHRLLSCAAIEVVLVVTISFVKQDRVPSWHTRPSPSTSTRNSKASLSQSVLAEITFKRFPDVSPFIQSLLRVRLKKVT